MPREILPSIGVEVWVRGGDGDLINLLAVEQACRKMETYQMQHRARQNRIYGEVDPSLHIQEPV